VDIGVWNVVVLPNVSKGLRSCSLSIVTALSTRLVHAENEVAAATNAVRDLRALVEEYELPLVQLPLRTRFHPTSQLLIVDFVHVASLTVVRSQVTEREKWQRYCWELEERLHDAVHMSNAREVPRPCVFALNDVCFLSPWLFELHAA
jgi:hypothetical protein